MTRHIMLVFLIFSFLFSSTSILRAQSFPGNHWLQYEDPTDAGLDINKLEELQSYFDKHGGSVFLVIIKGKVALSWGSPNRRFRQASARKSYMNGVYGCYAEKVDLDKTLAEIGITERLPLTPEEQKATIRDLMKTSSGIYLPSAYALNLDQLPKRGSAAPGEQWFYNNWDFNVLHTIFEKEVGKRPFQVFAKKIAQPLGMEDFRVQDTHLYYEKDKSEHPAYLFKLSARDVARYGWLYLRGGQWKGKQVIARDWITESTRAHTERLSPGFENRGGYGLLWWVGKPIEGHYHYYASGAGGQRLIVFPEDEMLVVHLTDTYQRKQVSQTVIDEMLGLLLDAKTGEPDPAGKTVNLKIGDSPKATGAFEKGHLEQWPGNYYLEGIGPVKIFAKKQQLFAEMGIGTFTILPQKTGHPILEDIEVKLRFQKADAETKGKAKFKLNDQREIEEVCFYF